MVKAEVKTPNKRKSIANNTPKIKVEKDSPVKKIKIENDTPAKKIKPENGQTPILKKEIVPSPKNNKKNQQGKPTNGAGPKPFKGTQQLNTNQKTNKIKPGQGDGVEKKKRRKSQFGTLMAEVKAKSGTKDAEVLTKLNQRIKDIKARGELTKTAKKKLSILNKMKLILEEGGDVAAAKSKIQRQKDIEEARKAREAKKALKKTDGTQVAETKKNPVQAKPAQAKPAQLKKVVQAEDSDEEEDDDDDDDEEEDEVDSDEEDDDDEEDDESEEEAPAPKAEKLPTNIDELKSKDIKGQKRFVLFVGNIPYDTTKQDLTSHFSKVGNIVHIRIPTEKGSNRPRGFAYVEVDCETAYQKCLSMHHSHLNSRRINVLYTQGGKKKGEEKKKEIKAKNFKLHALRQQGKLAGSVKLSQKRSFRRNKSKNNQPE